MLNDLASDFQRYFRDWYGNKNDDKIWGILSVESVEQFKLLKTSSCFS